MADTTDSLRFSPLVPLFVGVGAMVAAALAANANAEWAWAGGVAGVIAGGLGWILGTDAQRAVDGQHRAEQQLREANAELKALAAEEAVSPAEHDKLSERLAGTRADLAAAEAELVALREKLDQTTVERDALEKEATGLQEQLAVGGAAVPAANESVDTMRQRVAELEAMLASGPVSEQLSEMGSGQIARLDEDVSEALVAVDEISNSMSTMKTGLSSISDRVELLASNAEESSSSILEMAAANDEVAESMFNLAASVQQTATSIEEMTFSVKEVAKNIEALSTTAEETSSAMNEMDIS
ncbi:MAG: hypothetical protein AAF721_19000, partial [Myxococcota bacterium]